MEENLDIDSISKWIYSICVVNFDIDYGQVIEKSFPSNVNFTEDEKISISYSSFPDSHSSFLGDTSYHYRFKAPSLNDLYAKNNSVYKNYPAHLKPTAGYAFAYVLFRQYKDTSLRRNYFQKSIVIITPLSLNGLFYHVVNVIAPIFFENGDVTLESALRDISKWPAPCPGKELTLPILGYVINAIIPVGDCLSHSMSAGRNSLSWQEQITDNSSLNVPSSGPSNTDGVDNEALSASSNETESEDDSDFVKIPNPIGNHSNPLCPNDIKTSEFSIYGLDTSMHELCLFEAFKPVLSHLQTLWEVVITGQPILVLAPTPTHASRSVQALVLSIAPLAYAGEYRPFFTIHDAEYKDFTTTTIATSNIPIILGVTNPFFSKALNGWPNVLRLGSTNSEHEKDIKIKPFFKSLNLDESKPGFYTQHKPFLKRNSSQIKHIKMMAKTNPQFPADISQLIRKFFYELTRNFMLPLERYVSSLMPLHRLCSPFKGTPSLGRFNFDSFIKTLSKSGARSSKWIQGDIVGIYERFLSGPHFAAWLSERESEINRELSSIHLKSMCEANIDNWIQTKSKSEVELVDLILQIQSKLKEERNSATITDTQRTQLNRQIDAIVSHLPPDLKNMILNKSSGTPLDLS